MTRKYFDMIENVIKAYEALNAELIDTMPMNDSKTRKFIKDRLELELPRCEITCDETNNNPMLIDDCVAVARVMWMSKGMEIKYVDLIFGTPEQIAAVQLLLMNMF